MRGGVGNVNPPALSSHIKTKHISMNIYQQLDIYQEKARNGELTNEDFKLIFEITCDYISEVVVKLGHIEQLMTEAEQGESCIISAFNNTLATEIYRYLSDIDQSEKMTVRGSADYDRQLAYAAKAASRLRWRNIYTYEDAIDFKEKYGGVPCIDKSLDALLGFEWEYKSGDINFEEDT